MRDLRRYFFTVRQKPQSKWNSWAGTNWVVSQQMNAILLVKQMKLVAFLSVSVHSKCDFAQPTALLTGGFNKVQGMHGTVIKTNSVAMK
jgi:hypothetical protein